MLIKQLELEENMVSHGIDRYRKNLFNSEESGQASRSSYGRLLVPEYAILVANRVSEVIKTNRNTGGYLTCIKNESTLEMSIITLKVLINNIMLTPKLASTAVSIGRRIEDISKFRLFKSEHTAYFDTIIRDFKRKGTSSYRHKHNVLSVKMKHLEVSWETWSPENCFKIGGMLIDAVIESTNLFKKSYIQIRRRQKDLFIVPEDNTMEWITNHIHAMELLYPVLSPLLCEPLPWKTWDEGGYYSPALQNKIPLIKIRSKKHRQIIQQAEDDGDLELIKSAVNILQKIPWCINKGVYSVLLEVWKHELQIGIPAPNPVKIPDSPIPKDMDLQTLSEEEAAAFKQWKVEASYAYTREQERKSKCILFSTVMKQVKEYLDCTFWFSIQLDSRTRMYYNSVGLNPQGPDFVRGLMQYKKSVRLGESGAYSLALQGAGVYGNDNITLESRWQWIIDNSVAIQAVAKDPLDADSRKFWSNADKPYQFLAFCLDWKMYCVHGVNHASQLVCGIDGRCNGLQHYSAMLRDPVSSNYVNLTANDFPKSIHIEVANDVTNKLKAINSELALAWLKVGITKKITKKPVMTLPYSSTKRSCRNGIVKFIAENETPFKSNKKIWEAAAFLSDVIWDSTADTLKSAVVCMKWLKNSAKKVSKVNSGIMWKTVLGVPVYRATYKRDAVRVSIWSEGVQFAKCNIRKDTSKINSLKQSQGIAPDFIHSSDASHLFLTVLTTGDLPGYSMIHDEYCTHAAHVNKLTKCTKASFVAMYKTFNTLKMFKEDVEQFSGVELDEPPAKGTFDMDEVLKSDYFFS